jgi:hypothetical protein
MGSACAVSLHPVPSRVAMTDRLRDPDAHRRKVVVTTLIALTTFLGAIGAWRATAAGAAAGGFEYKALSDERASAQRQAVIRSGLASIEFDYMRQTTHRIMAAELRTEAATAGPDDAARLEAEAAGHEAAANSIFIDPDALDPTGALDLGAKYDIEWSLARSQLDLDPNPEFVQADRLRTKQERIVGTTALFVVAALFLTLARVSRNPASRNLYFAGGAAVLSVATVFLTLVEFG